MAHLTWTPEMGNLAADPARETQTRRAVEAAVNFMTHLPALSRAPIWNLSSVAATPRNDTARAMSAAIRAQLDGFAGVELHKTIALAVRWAYFVVNTGTAEQEYADGWAALGGRVREIAQRHAAGRGARGQRRPVAQPATPAAPAPPGGGPVR